MRIRPHKLELQMQRDTQNARRSFQRQEITKDLYQAGNSLAVQRFIKEL